MEVYQVKVFLEVARSLNFTEAAEALNLTQPAVSAQVKNLEAELKTLLFHRLGRKVQLTEAGEFLAAEGHRLVEAETQLCQGIQAIQQGQTGKLILGGTSAAANGWLPQQVWQFSQQFPGIQLQVQTYDQVIDLYRALAEERVDLGCCEAVPLAQLDYPVTPQELTHFRYGLVAAPQHPLAGQTWLGLADVQAYPLVLLPPGTPSRIILEARLQELGLSLASFTQVQTVDTLALLRTYVTEGEYLGFVAELEFASERQAGQLHSLNMLEFAFPSSLHLLLPKRFSVPPPARRPGSSSPAEKFIRHVLPTQSPDTAPHAALGSGSNRMITSPRCQAPPEVISLRLGVQNATLPAVTAGLVIQRLGLLEQFLPRQGRYSQVRYDLSWHNYPSGAPIAADLHQGKLDFGVLGDYPLLLSALDQQGQPKSHLISFVAANPQGSCNAIVVPQASPLRKLTDLRGRSLALPLGSSAHGMVMRSLAAAELLQEVELRFLSTETCMLLPRLSRGKTTSPALPPADSYAHFAPFPELACRQGQFRYLLSADYQQTPAFYGVVASADLAQQHPEIVLAYLQALQAAQTWYQHTIEAPSMVGQWLGLETELVSQILSPNQPLDQAQHFVPTLDLRADWLAQHINQLAQVPDHAEMSQLQLSQWLRPEFLAQLNN